MKKYVVEIVEKVTYKVDVDTSSPEDAENAARAMYDSGMLEGEGELENVSFDVEANDGITEVTNTSHNGINDKDFCPDELVREEK